MTLEAILEIINRQLIATQNHPLSSTEVLVVRGIWQYQTYGQIAQAADYSSGYLTNVVAPELCRRLSAIVGQRVTKKNCRALLEAYGADQAALDGSQQLLDGAQNLSPPFPSGSVPLESSFYIERSPIEELVYREINQPGALVRIKAPREMGKTSLLLRLLDYGDRLGYRTVSLNLEQIDFSILQDLQRFLRWLCANISQQLRLESKLDDYWDEDIGSKVSCTLYMRYILEQINSPLILALDEVNQIFEHPQVAKDVLPLLRSWYEEGKRTPLWQKLRLVVVHSTEIYVPLQLQQSPFNVGLPIQLPTFSLIQVQELAKRYGLDWKNSVAASQLMAMVEGHPALINIALYHLSHGQLLTDLLANASTSSGIYHHHLQRYWATLQQQPELALALHRVMNSTQPVQLEPISAYKLSSMGMIKLENNKAKPSCQLYQQYFINQQTNGNSIIA